MDKPEMSETALDIKAYGYMIKPSRPDEYLSRNIIMGDGEFPKCKTVISDRPDFAGNRNGRS